MGRIDGVREVWECWLSEQEAMCGLSRQVQRGVDESTGSKALGSIDAVELYSGASHRLFGM